MNMRFPGPPAARGKRFDHRRGRGSLRRWIAWKARRWRPGWLSLLVWCGGGWWAIAQLAARMPDF